MNRHLAPYLTNSNPLLREWVRERINREDIKFEVIEHDIGVVPEEHVFVNACVNIRSLCLGMINRKVLYCKSLICMGNQLEELPALPVCQYLKCGYNELRELPDLPVCRYLNCDGNKLKFLPELPVCKELTCFKNRLRELPDLPLCELLRCCFNKLKKLPALPVCQDIECDYYLTKQGVLDE